jgi:surface polysaccharide O-acyltransferase-like enzyme
MPLFFILSGYFTAMQWKRRGLAGMVLARLRHVGLPLLAGLFTFIPITHWIFSQGAIDAVAWPGRFYHLWFLWYLLLVAGCFSTAAWLGMRFRHRVWWLLVPAPVVPQYFMRQMLGADISTVITPEPSIFGYYLVFFVFGAFLYQRRVQVRRWWAAALLPALPVMPLALVFLYPDRIGFVDPEGPWTAIAAAVFQVDYTWLACFGLMGLFRTLATRERAWVRYVSDASYWIYLSHLPLVIWMQMLAVDWPVNPHLAFVLISVAVPGLLLVIYAWGVRYTWVGTLLNGKRVRVRPALSDG